jgi:acyl-coenzyme A synthetase/AMP-(fatty) acid ligase
LSVFKAILEHHELSECAVVELKDSLKGALPFAFLIRKKSKKFNPLNQCFKINKKQKFILLFKKLKTRKRPKLN